MKKILFAIAAASLMGFGLAQDTATLGSGGCNNLGTSSTDIAWDEAYLDVCVQGTLPEQAAFTVTTANINLDTGALEPGQEYTIRFKISNPTDRDLDVTDDLQDAIGNTPWATYITGPGTVEVSSGASDVFYDITVDFPTDDTNFESELNQAGLNLGETVSLNFNLLGTAQASSQVGLQND